MADSTDIQNAIIGAAEANGVDPAWALSVAERESDFNPNARASKTIAGVFQMTKGLRDEYGIGDSTDPSVQANGFMKYAKDLKGEMASVLGREPTDQELYAGHHFGGVRAARMIANMDPNTPVTDVFTRQEMQGNPHFAKAGTVGNLLGSVTSDIGTRMAKFGGNPLPTAATPAGTVAANTAATPFDYSAFGPAASDTTDAATSKSKAKTTAPQQSDDTADDTLAPIKTALAPPIPQQQPSTGASLPALPSVADPKLGLDPNTILRGKPSLAGSLAPALGVS